MKKKSTHSLMHLKLYLLFIVTASLLLIFSLPVQARAASSVRYRSADKCYYLYTSSGTPVAKEGLYPISGSELHRQLNYRASDIYGTAIQFLGASMTPLLLVKSVQFNLHSYFYYFWG